MEAIILLRDEVESRMRKIARLDQELEGLPRGSLCNKRIRGKEYCYLQWREGRKTVSRYVKEGEREGIRMALQRRKELAARKKALEEEVALLKRRGPLPERTYYA